MIYCCRKNKKVEELFVKTVFIHQRIKHLTKLRFDWHGVCKIQILIE